MFELLLSVGIMATLAHAKEEYGTAMEILEPHIKSGLGVAFKADNNKYLSLMAKGWDWGIPVEAAKDTKDIYCRFYIEKIDGNTIALYERHSHRYLSRYHNRDVQYIASSKDSLDRFCKFKVYTEGGKLIFQADNGKFLSRNYRGGRQNIEAVKDGIDQFCKFSVETGSLTPVVEEILSVKWGSLAGSDSALAGRVKVLDTRIVDNETKSPVTKKVVFKKSITKHQSTSWEHGWGVTTGIKISAEFSAGLPLVGESKVKTEFSLQVNFNGKKAGNEGKAETVEFTDETVIDVPPGKKMIVRLMVKEAENVAIPFTARIRRTSQIGAQEFEEKGTWYGVFLYESYTNVQEKDL